MTGVCSFDRVDLPVLLVEERRSSFSPPVKLQPVLLEKFFQLAPVLARFAPFFRLPVIPITITQHV